MLRSIIPMLCSAAVFAQPPHIYYRQVVNAAHFLPPGLPQGALARGSVVSIFGARLGPAASPTLSFPLAAELGGVALRITQGSTSVPGYPLFVSPTQINAIIPSNAPLGAASLIVTYNGRDSGVAPVRIVNSSFGIYTALGTGNGPGIFQNFVSPESQPVNAPATAARPGQVVTLWGTGLGPVTHADNVAPTPGTLPTRTEVFVGGAAANIAYSGRSSCCSGTDQIVFTVPADAPLGCWVPVQVRTEGVNSSNVVTMAITPNGAPCADSQNPYSSAVRGGGRLGELLLHRVVSPMAGLTATPGFTDTTVDVAVVNFRQLSSHPFGFQPALSLPPTGSCTVTAGAGPLGSEPPALPFARRLSPGSTLTVTAGTATRTVSIPPGSFVAQLGKLLPGTPARPTLMLAPGGVTIRGPGSAEVGAIDASASMPSLVWTNRSQITAVNRAQPLTVAWSGPAAGQIVTISGGTSMVAANSHAEFLCVAPAGAASFTVPAAILQAIPPTGPRAFSNLRVGAISNAPFAASGLDTGVVSAATFIESFVVYQ